MAKYARKLLQKKQMRTLIIFGNIVHKELRLWLSREKRRAALVEDLQGALDSIHRQFDLPFPEVFPLNAIQADAAEDDSSSSSNNSSPRLQRSTSSLGQYSSVMSPSKFLVTTGSSFQGPKIDSPIKRFIEIEANNDGSLTGMGDNQKVSSLRLVGSRTCTDNIAVTKTRVCGSYIRHCVEEECSGVYYRLRVRRIAVLVSLSHLTIDQVLASRDFNRAMLRVVPRHSNCII